MSKSKVIEPLVALQSLSWRARSVAAKEESESVNNDFLIATKMLDVWQVTATFSGIKGISKTIITNVIIASQLKKGGGGGEGTQNHLIFKIRHSFPFNNPTFLVSTFFLIDIQNSF